MSHASPCPARDPGDDLHGAQEVVFRELQAGCVEAVHRRVWTG